MHCSAARRTARLRMVVGISARAGCVALAMAAPLLLAAPADWFRFVSRTGSSSVVCAHASPGPGWVLDSGPYLEHTCQVRRRSIRP